MFGRHPLSHTTVHQDPDLGDLGILRSMPEYPWGGRRRALGQLEHSSRNHKPRNTKRPRSLLALVSDNEG